MTGRGPPETLVVAAMPEELRGFRPPLGPAPRLRVVVGETAARAAPALARRIDRDAPGRVLIVGVCGGLSRELDPCDLVLPDAVGTPDEEAPPPDAAWRARVSGALAARAGRMVSIERVATSADAKRALASRFGPDAVAVDLETAALARVAAARDVPYLVIRAVSDTVDESMPDFLVRSFRADGSMSRLAVVRRALFHRRRWKVLRAMNRRMSRCAAALARAASIALES